MRVNRRVRRDDRGAVLIIVAAFLIVAVIFLAFVIDIGNQRQDRRQLATGTDAAALDVAQVWADTSLSASYFPPGPGGYDCSGDAQEFLQRNRVVDAGDYSCEAVLLNGQLASVSVFAKGTTEYAIGPAVGLDSGAVRSRTTVRIGSTPGGGARPFALCAFDGLGTPEYGDPSVETFAEYLANPNRTYPKTFVIGGDKFLPPECGTNNGNWGFVQFESQANGVGNTNGDGLAGTLLRGTDDELRAYDGPGSAEQQICIDDDADNIHYDDQSPRVSCVYEVTGAGAWNNSDTEEALDHLKSEGVVFNLPIYGERVNFPGSETGFPIIAFAEVRLVDFDSQGAEDNSLTIEVLSMTFNGDCCDVNMSNKRLTVCDVGDPGGNKLATFTTACQTSSANGGGGGSVTPPPVCTPVALSPATLTRSLETANGSNKDKLTTEAVYYFDVQSGAACSGVGVTVVGGSGAGKDPAPTSITRLDNRFTITFGAFDQKFTPGATYSVEVTNGGASFNPKALAELRTN